MQTQIPTGFSFYTGNYNPKKYEKNNLLAIVADTEVFCAGMFTKNTCCGAPITVAKKILTPPNQNIDIFSGYIQAVLVNTNISNVATGEKGIKDCETQAKLLADSLKISCEKTILTNTKNVKINLIIQSPL